LIKLKDSTKKAIYATFAVVLFTAMLAAPALTTEAQIEEPAYEFDEDVLGVDLNFLFKFAGLALPESAWKYTLAGGLLLWLLSTSSPGGTLSDEIKKYARETEMINTQEKIMLVSALATNLVDNDRQVLALSEMHFNRLMEIASAATWYEGASYNSDLLLVLSSVMDLLIQINGNIQYSLDSAYNAAGNRVPIWKGPMASDWSGGLTEKLIWNGGTTADATDRLNLDFCTIVTAGSGTATTGTNLVYLDTKSRLENDPNDPMSKTVYAFQPGSIVNPSTGLSYSLPLGATDVSAIPSGWYWLTGGIYAGPFLSSTTPGRAAATEGGAVIVCDGTYGYITAKNNGLNITYNGVSYPSSPYLRYSLSADGKTMNTPGSPSRPEFLADMIQSYSNYYKQVKDSLFSAADAGLTMWTISAQAKASNILLSPAAVIPYMVNAGMDPIMAYGFYVTALEQIATYWNNYGEILRAADMKISADSLDLICYGNIYNPDGTVLRSGVVFTPYVYLHNMFISKATSYNEYTQPGVIMVWDENVTTAVDWDGTQTDRITSLVVDSGVYFEITEMFYKGKPITSITLTVKTVQGLGIFPNTHIGLIKTPTALNVTILFMVIFVLLGFCIILIGLPIRIPSPMVVLVGIIVIIVGVLFSEFLASFIIRSGWFGFLYA
jgi:hypothetical protein